jgi:hypothetical protein
MVVSPGHAVGLHPDKYLGTVQLCMRSIKRDTPIILNETRAPGIVFGIGLVLDPLSGVIAD